MKNKLIALSVVVACLAVIVILGNSGTSGIQKGLLAKVFTDATISKVEVKKVSDTSVAIYWNTDKPTTSQVLYMRKGGKDFIKTDIQKETTEKEFGATSHRVIIDNLDPKENYEYYVSSCDVSGVCGISRQAGFSLGGDTLLSTDVTPPSIPQNLDAISIGTTSLTLTWSPSTDDTDPQADIVYDIYGPEGVCGTTGLCASQTGTLSISITGLTPGGYYGSPSGPNAAFSIQAHDSSGNYSQRTNQLQVQMSPDNQDPTTPTNFSSPAKTTTTISLQWDPSTDDVGVAGYQIYVGASAYTGGSITGTSYTLTNLIPGTQYTIRIRSIDTGYNTSPFSPPLTVTTNPNTSGPVISNITTTGTTSVTRKIAWTTDVPATTQVLYDTVSHATGGAYPYATTAVSTLVTAHRVSMYNLTSGQTYYYKVKSTNAAGITTLSSENSFTSPTCANAPAAGYPFPLQMWVWKDNSDIVDTSTQTSIDFFNFINSHKIQTVYLNLPTVFFGNTNDVDNLKDFLNIARDQYCLEVEALDGAADWVALPGNTYFTSGGTTTAAVDWANTIKSFNNSITAGNAKLIGMQYDVEPYLLNTAQGYPSFDPQWGQTTAGNQKIANAYLDMTEAIRATLAGSDVLFDMAPPRWLDTDTGLTDSTFIRTPNGTGSISGKSVMKHLFDSLDMMTVQDYVVTGSSIYNDGRNELDYGITLGKKVRLGVETAPGYGATTSFSDVAGATCTNMMNQLVDAYSRIVSNSRSAGFEGFGIEYYKRANNTPYAYSLLCP